MCRDIVIHACMCWDIVIHACAGILLYMHVQGYCYTCMCWDIKILINNMHPLSAKGLVTSTHLLLGRTLRSGPISLTSGCNIDSCMNSAIQTSLLCMLNNIDCLRLAAQHCSRLLTTWNAWLCTLRV